MSPVKTYDITSPIMNQDASPRPRQSPTGEYGSDPGSSASSKPSSKRASRAGTRSVSTLSAAQLERKRANDREAQRAIRQRTKDHIENLERRISELTGGHEAREKIFLATQQRNRELEEENVYLRSRLSGESFTVNVSENEEKPPQYSVSAPESSPQTHLTAGMTIARPASSSTSRSVPQQTEPWRQHQYSPSGAPAAGPFMTEGAAAHAAGTNPASWRAHDVSPGGAYGYSVRQGDRASNYQSSAHQVPYQSHHQAAQFQQAISAQAPTQSPVAATFHGAGVAPHSEFSSIPQYGTTQSGYHDQQAYVAGAPAVSSSAPDYHGAQHRASLAPPAYNSNTASTHFMPQQTTPTHNTQMAFREGTTQHSYNYDG